MSGEYCSQLANIQKAREKLHPTSKRVEIKESNNLKNKGREINAFVIMNFSNMSDVAYKWQLRPFVESLKDYFYFKGDNLVCSKDRKNPSDSDKKDWVAKINVVRADSTYDSNYVICNRVCQQIQIADLIVVDVSSENNNVFYEFGMAVAMGKLILPICFSESFYQIVFPESLKVYSERQLNCFDMETSPENKKIKHLKHHIDCYPWRRILFENYGLRYRRKEDSRLIEKKRGLEISDELEVSHEETTQYISFAQATDPRYGFSDIQYSKFPYIEVDDSKENYLGKQIYARLGKSYNSALYKHNTLVVYTMNGFLNGEQAGTCICNFYHAFTKQFQKEHCFCGDRVGILLEPSDIPETVKDSKKQRHLLYNVGDIIHLGTNEATFSAQREMIKTADYLNVPSCNNKADEDGCFEINNLQATDHLIDTERMLIFTKNYIRNRAIPIYPHRPIHVRRVNDGLQTDVLDVGKKKKLNQYYCYFHVMLRTLKYVNEIVVDISKNSLASLFWLGAAHGANVNAITVQHEQSVQERILITGSPEKRERAIFDMAGLWSALLRSHEVERFYQQLASVQKGIEQRSKLILSDFDARKTELDDMLYDESLEYNDIFFQNGKETSPSLHKLLVNRHQAEQLALESYYRDRFWKPMMRNSHLRIYFSQYYAINEKNPNENNYYPRVTVSKWDIDALSTLSHYLSVRTHVGEYSFIALGKDKNISDKNIENFISIGNDVKPMKSAKSKTAITLAEYMQENCIIEKSVYTFQRFPYEKNSKEDNKNKTEKKNGCDMKEKKAQVQYQGYMNKEEYIYSQIPCPDCYACMNPSENAENNAKWQCQNLTESNPTEILNLPFIGNSMLKDEYRKNDPSCLIKKIGKEHYQVAQLLLWREVNSKSSRVYYRMALNGASGPATKALSSLVVNDEHRKDVFNWSENIQDNTTDGDYNPIRIIPLSLMQQYLRKELMIKIRSNIKMLENNIFKLEYATMLYLSSVLYRYFIPFLSLEDEERIVNGLKYFLASFIASESKSEDENISLNENNQIAIQQKTIMHSILDTVRNILKNLCGVEAFYQVKVLSKEGYETDTRSCVDIDMLKVYKEEDKTKKEEILPRCLFREEKESNGTNSKQNSPIANSENSFCTG